MAVTSPSKAVVGNVPSKEVGQPTVQGVAPTRREFLYYIWGASIAMWYGQISVGILWFSLPRFREGTFGGKFRLTADKIPLVAGAAPYSEASGRFWISHLEPVEGSTESRVVSLYGVCTHLGCLPRWNTVNHRFECPCHGSKYELDGKWIEGPAPRGLDRFAAEIVMLDGTSLLMNEAGDPISLGSYTVGDIKEIVIDTGKKIQLPPHI
jgi:cytochrome b6-f complex iron-sulfur subunit